MLDSIRHNLTSLADFRGRSTARQFWPFALLVIALGSVAALMIMFPEFNASMARMQAFAAKNPELATVQSSPGHYSISVEGHHPELMPDMKMFVTAIGSIVSVSILFLAAAVARRLRDRGSSALWGLLPIPFLAYGLYAMPKLLAADELEIGQFLLLFVNNILYLASLSWLLALLAGKSAGGESAA